MRQIGRIFTVIALLMALAACGTKGSLYMPEPEPAAQPDSKSKR